MADKQMSEGLQIALERGALEIETVHPKPGEVINSNQLPGINWFFTLLAGRMGLKGKSSVTELKSSPPELFFDGDSETAIPESIVLPPQQIFVFRGKSQNGEETEFSHNKFLPGMPFELTVVTTKTVTAKAKDGRELTPETLSKPFGKDVCAAMDTAGIDNLNRVTAVSETVRVLTLARVEWFPGMFEGSGTTYQITRIIRSETTRVITFAGLTGQVTEKKEISAAGGMTKPDNALSDFDRMFADMPELNPIIASQAVLIPVDELELSDYRLQPEAGRQDKPQSAPVEDLKVQSEPKEKPQLESAEQSEAIQSEPEEESKPEPVEEPEVIQPEPEEEPLLEPAEESEVIQSEPEEDPKPEQVEELEVKPEPEEVPNHELIEELKAESEFEEESMPESAKELQFSIQDLQRMFEQLTSQVSEPIREEIFEHTWQPEQTISQPEPVQDISEPEVYQTPIVSQPALEVVEVPTAAVQLRNEWQYTSPSRVSDRMIDDILGDLDVLVKESHSLSRQKQSLPKSVQSKAVHNFFRLEKKNKK